MGIATFPARIHKVRTGMLHRISSGPPCKQFSPAVLFPEFSLDDYSKKVPYISLQGLKQSWQGGTKQPFEFRFISSVALRAIYGDLTFV